MKLRKQALALEDGVHVVVIVAIVATAATTTTTIIIVVVRIRVATRLPFVDNEGGIFFL